MQLSGQVPGTILLALLFNVWPAATRQRREAAILPVPKQCSSALAWLAERVMNGDDGGLMTDEAAC